MTKQDIIKFIIQRTQLQEFFRKKHIENKDAFLDYMESQGFDRNSATIDWWERLYSIIKDIDNSVAALNLLLNGN